MRQQWLLGPDRPGAGGIGRRPAACRPRSQHKETPGLGDYIDPKKDKNKSNPWIEQFSGQGYDLALGGHWKVKKDGGRFDARAGATISARAVTNASGKALIWIAERRAALFALPAGTTLQEKTP
jgi:electron transport complex protein RnfG